MASEKFLVEKENRLLKSVVYSVADGEVPTVGINDNGVVVYVSGRENIEALMRDCCRALRCEIELCEAEVFIGNRRIVVPLSELGNEWPPRISINRRTVR